MRLRNGTKVTAIKHVLLRQLREGEYKEGAQLPSGRDIAKAFDVSPVTATLALSELTNMGLTEARTGAGTFVVQRSSHESRQLVFGMVCGHWLSDTGLFHHATQSPSLPYYYEGIRIYGADEKGISIQLIRYHEHHMMEDNSELRRALESKQLDGLLILTKCDNEEIKCILRYHVPMVMCSHRALMWDIPWVEINEISGFRQLISLLMGHGHTRVRVLMNAVVGRTKEDICCKYIETARAVGLQGFDSESIFMNNPTAEDRASRETEYVHVVSEIMATKPTAVIAVDEVASDFIIRHCIQNGLEIPRDLSLVAMNDMTPTSHPLKLTALNIPDAIVDMMYEASALLNNAIAGEEVTLRTKITPSIIMGASVGPPKL